MTRDSELIAMDRYISFQPLLFSLFLIQMFIVEKGEQRRALRSSTRYTFTPAPFTFKKRIKKEKDH